MNLAYDHPQYVWLIKNLSVARALRSPSIYIKGIEFQLILEKISYLNPRSDVFEVHLQEMQSKRRRVTNFMVLVHIRGTLGYKHFFQKSEFVRRQFISSHCVWKAKCLDVFRVLEWKEHMFIVCDIRPESKCQLGTSDESNLRNMDIPCCKSLKSLSSDLSRMFHTGAGTDVVIECGEESQQIYAHKSILATRSPVFSEIFQRCEDSTLTRTFLEIREIDSVTFEHFLEFIYTGKIYDNCTDRIWKLYKAAQKYRVRTLMEECVAAIMQKMTINLAYTYLLLVEKYQDENFKHSLIDFMIGKNILLSDSWYSFTEKNPDLSISVYFSFFTETADRYISLPAVTDFEIEMESFRDQLL